jgi:hypothetical protein
LRVMWKIAPRSEERKPNSDDTAEELWVRPRGGN